MLAPFTDEETEAQRGEAASPDVSAGSWWCWNPGALAHGPRSFPTTLLPEAVSLWLRDFYSNLGKDSLKWKKGCLAFISWYHARHVIGKLDQCITDPFSFKVSYII